MPPRSLSAATTGEAASAQAETANTATTNQATVSRVTLIEGDATSTTANRLYTGALHSEMRLTLARAAPSTGIRISSQKMVQGSRRSSAAGGTASLSRPGNGRVSASRSTIGTSA